jgi:shikimate 5-dehydrogenase
VAIITYFATRHPVNDRPRRIVVVNRSQGRLDGLKELVCKLPKSSVEFDFVLNSDPQMNDRLMEDLPAHSMVINATGMGKDTPGSPISNMGVFPADGIAWELNYRGELDFLQQAQAQEKSRRLTIEDGWYYFLLGWSQIVGTVFDVPITPEVFKRLTESAESIRH